MLSVAGLGQHHRFSNYNAVEGLSQNGVHALMEDHQGNIWMGTRGGGLNRFNGLSFLPYTTFDGLSNNWIQCLFQDSKGTIWVGTDNGLNSFNGHSFKQYSTKLAPEETFVISGITESIDHQILVASNKGLFMLEQDSLVPIPINITFDYISFLEKAPNGDVWIGVNNELIKYHKNGIERYSSPHGLGSNRIASACFLPGNRIAVTVYADGLYIFENNRFTPYLHGKIESRFVNALHSDSNHNLWVGTNNSGVYKINIDEESYELLNVSDGLANDHVESILEDSWGNIWIGTGGSGVSKYHRAAFSQITERNGLPGNWIYSVIKDSSDRVWIGSGARGVTVFTDSSLETYDAYSGFITAKVRHLFKDHKNRIWLAPEGGGLWVYDSSFHQVKSDLPRVPFDHIKSMTQSNDGHFWICEGGKGIVEFEYIDSTHHIHSLSHITSRDGLPRNYIYALHCDGLGRIWFGTRNGGSGYIYNGIVYPLGTTDGLAGNSVVMIDEDEDGFVWLAGGDGITRVTAFKTPLEFEKYGREDGIIGNPVYQVYSDSNGYLWVGTSRGVTRFIKENGLLSNPKHYGYAEGFMGLETNSKAVCIGQKGKVYFGTGDGLMVYEGDYSNERSLPPKIGFLDIKLFYESITNTPYGNVIGDWGEMKEKLTLPHDQNNLGFDFIGVSQINPNKVMYSWILEGFDRDWTPALPVNSAAYSNLPPGTYTFKVKAANSEGIWSETITSKPIVISAPPPPPPPFYKQTWFITTVSVIGTLILILVGVILYLRIKRERERIKMERNLLELEQKALRLQMNPHFIFNALNSIQSLISLKDTQKARYQLAKFSKLMRQILDNSRTQLIALEDEMETLNNYLFLEQNCGGNAFDYVVESDAELNLENTAVPPMMIQPFAENALIHGIRNMDKPGKISIRFSRHKNHVECIVEDNGIGRKKATELKNQKNQTHKSTALAVTQERLDILIGKSELKGLEIIDKIDETKNPEGTLVIIRFPYLTFD